MTIIDKTNANVWSNLMAILVKKVIAKPNRYTGSNLMAITY